MKEGGGGGGCREWRESFLHHLLSFNKVPVADSMSGVYQNYAREFLTVRLSLRVG